MSDEPIKAKVICNEEGRHPRGPRILGTYRRFPDGDNGGAVWAEAPIRSARVQRREEEWNAAHDEWISREDHNSVEMPQPVHLYGRRPNRGITARLMREDGALVSETTAQLVNMIRMEQRITGTDAGAAEVDPRDLAARAVFMWRCPCGLELVLREERAFPLFDAVAARGRKSVHLRELIDWTQDGASYPA